MTKRYLIGGPSNSGKSTFVLSLVEYLRSTGKTAEAVELDVWSNSYTAFRGEVPFDKRPKRQGLDWDWKAPLEARVREFRGSTADVVFGDLPGKLDEAISHICASTGPDAAIVVSRTVEGLAKWREYFIQNGITVEHDFLTFLGKPPIILVGMDRQLDPDHDVVQEIGDILIYGQKPDETT